ncbi:hypothetical protein CAPTEDRAFT_212223 [Capitella teleta]|uniref:G-protein coupled receptors family 1 profile domain-containing protein n=1 Tax=Capitella teleta TaxID=283909 RepID=R7UAC4_CAPTE|nr:hypothetical protein CAPTEDRAFT_212223 [Capitella teleta]|eukprot:ELU00091.1 hypothetical protein CAPTEDRAFT_212223 [Capitella teleta]
MSENSTQGNDAEPWQQVTLSHFAGFLAWMSLAGGTGIAGNILVIALYPRRQRLSFLSGIFIHRLAIVDLLASLVVVPYNVIFELRLVRHVVACKICEFFRYLVISCSLLMLIGVAIERYYAICRPLMPFNQRHVQLILYLMFAAAVLMAFPSVFVYSVFLPAYDDDRPFLCTPHPSCAPSRGLIGTVYGAVILIAFCVLSLTLLALYTVIYIHIVRHLRMKHSVQPLPCASNAPPADKPDDVPTVSGRTSQNMSSSQFSTARKPRQGQQGSIHSGEAAFRTQVRSASMLFGVTLVFIMSWVPFFLTKLRVINYNTVLHYLFFFNHASNIFIYVAFNRRFKKNLLDRTRLLINLNRVLPVANNVA